ncbi:hypothetical protein DPMN_076443 [Dreissena polymorpha]|uniref:Tubulin-specific chaperone cofactor E-like protein n=1 Tax=Dreissena polymorpha TaxID=45954 RepID=A0A9D3YLI1_DREPO|nr:hypothetical protein DPMN_076443 [Dreissena polymorpha]
MRTLTEAIKEKYEDTGLDTDSAVGMVKVYAPRKRNISSSSDDLQLPPRLTMDYENIDSVGDETSLSHMCRYVKELDLTKNCMKDWKQVFKVLELIPQLVFLNMTSNDLSKDTLPADCQGRSFHYLETLILNNTNVTWDELSTILPCFPSLQELHLSMNQYSSVEIPSGFCHPTLVRLYMNDCDISDWHNFSKLGQAFPNLVSMTIIDCNIKVLPDEASFTEFSALTCLNLSHSNFETWEEIDKFRRFPVLSSLRITGVPFLEETEAFVRRQQLIARLPNVTQLNGSNISDTEREDAERAFIRLYMETDHPPERYATLEKKYGRLDPLANVDLSISRSMNLLVKFEDKSEFMDINLHQTFGELKKILRNFTQVPPSQFVVYYVEMFEGNPKDTRKLVLPNLSLLSLNMKIGDEIHIDRK